MSELKWGEVKLSEVIWSMIIKLLKVLESEKLGVKWSGGGVKWSDLKRVNKKSKSVRKWKMGGEVKWSEVKWSEVTWN